MKKRREYIHCILDSAFYSSVGINSKEQLIEELLVQAIRQDVEVKNEEGVSYPLSYILKEDLEEEREKLINFLIEKYREDDKVSKENLGKIAEEIIIKENLGALALLRINNPFLFRDYVTGIDNYIDLEKLERENN